MAEMTTLEKLRKRFNEYMRDTPIGQALEGPEGRAKIRERREAKERQRQQNQPQATAPTTPAPRRDVASDSEVKDYFKRLAEERKRKQQQQGG